MWLISWRPTHQPLYINPNPISSPSTRFEPKCHQSNDMRIPGGAHINQSILWEDLDQLLMYCRILPMGGVPAGNLGCDTETRYLCPNRYCVMDTIFGLSKMLYTYASLKGCKIKRTHLRNQMSFDSYHYSRFIGTLRNHRRTAAITRSLCPLLVLSCVSRKSEEYENNITLFRHRVQIGQGAASSSGFAVVWWFASGWLDSEGRVFCFFFYSVPSTAGGWL